MIMSSTKRCKKAQQYRLGNTTRNVVKILRANNNSTTREFQVRIKRTQITNLNCEKSPLICVTPILQGSPFVKDRPTVEQTVQGTTNKTLRHRHALMAQVTVIKGHVQETHNNMGWPAVAPHILETITPLGRVMNQATAEMLLRAATPITETQGTVRKYREKIGPYTMAYDFDTCIGFADERIVYTMETLLREKVTGTDSHTTLFDMNLSSKNKETKNITVKNRRCQLLSVHTTEGVKIYTDMSVVKLGQFASQLLYALNEKRPLTTIEVGG